MKKVSEVFTPRSADVNPIMYAQRPDLEASLMRAVDGTLHLLIYGESGNGKSWLFKSVFSNHGVTYISANCGNASRMGSLTDEITNAAFPEGRLIKNSINETKSVTANAYVVEGGLSTENVYSVEKPEPLLEAFKKVSERANGKHSIIVIENLESIFNNEKLMSELADIIILLDDSRYSILNVKLLIVGTPSGVLEYFSKTKNQESVSNRIHELSKVESLTYDQVLFLVNKGFVTELEFQINLEHVIEISKHVFRVTLGVAQRVHEYCEELAYLIKDASSIYSKELLAKADICWLKKGLRQSYAVIEANLNSRNTAIARKSQVVLALGALKKPQFDYTDIESYIRKEFPSTIPDTNMGVSAILSEMATAEDDAILIKNRKTGLYRVRDPRYIMCIRAALFKNASTGKVEKKHFLNG